MERAGTDAESSSWLLPVVALTAVDGVFLLVLWCVCDFFTVHSSRYPAGVHDYDSLLPFLLLAPFALDYLACRLFRLAPAWLISIIATLLAIPLGIFLILQFGVPFHWSIGGHL
jgi:hypothetical protein